MQMSPVPIPRYAVFLALGLALGPFCGGPVSASPKLREEPAPVAPSGDVEERFKALEAELDQAVSDFWQAVEESGDKPNFEEYPYTSFFGRFVELADAGSLGATKWVLDSFVPDKGAVYGTYLERLLANETADDDLDRLLAYLHYSPAAADESVLEILGAYSQREGAQYPLTARMAKGMLMMSMEGHEAAGLVLLETLAESGESFTGSDSLAGELFKAKHLQVGMLAPDFETKDVDGMAFKLSDFRGKVTVVEFWGFW